MSEQMEKQMKEKCEGALDEYLDEFREGTIRYQLNLIFLLDVSGSMYGESINQLNVAMAEAVQVAEEAAKEKEVRLNMRVIQFDSGAKYIIGAQEHGVEHIDWNPLMAQGTTNTAAALDLAAGVMHRKYLGVRNYRPVVILVTDGLSNEPQKTLDAVTRLKNSLKSATDPNKDKIMRIAIGVKGANESELRGFASIGNIEHEDETMEENVPLVFKVDEVAKLKGLLRNLTVSSILSSLTGGTDGNKADDVPTISLAVDDGGEDDWEE